MHLSSEISHSCLLYGSRDSPTESMRAYFERFGEVKDCTVMKDSLQPPGLKKNRFYQFLKPVVTSVLLRCCHVCVGVLDLFNLKIPRLWARFWKPPPTFWTARL